MFKLNIKRKSRLSKIICTFNTFFSLFNTITCTQQKQINIKQNRTEQNQTDETVKLTQAHTHLLLWGFLLHLLWDIIGVGFVVLGLGLLVNIFIHIWP